jgi:AraC-like DNA-binding protein
MPHRSKYSWHVHDSHQLAWAPVGVLSVATATRTWVLPPSRALWIPAGVPHETMAAGQATMRSLYLRAQGCRVRWPEPQPVVVRPLLRELINHLSETELSSRRRHRSEAVLIDLLEPVTVTTVDAPPPSDPRARAVADALRRNPADTRGLAQWGHDVGASPRTLSRAFRHDTGISFDRWRTLARINASLPMLAAGANIATTSLRVGYQTPSAFVAAFRREIGTTPAAYFTRFGADKS